MTWKARPERKPLFVRRRVVFGSAGFTSSSFGVLRDEHDRAIRADQEKHRRNAPDAAHGMIRVMLGLCEQVIERFGFRLQLH